MENEERRPTRPRAGMGQNERTWLTFDGTIKTTVMMTDPEVGQLIGLIEAAGPGERTTRGSPPTKVRLRRNPPPGHRPAILREVNQDPS